ncbi:MAG: hypothetical protein ACJAX5_001013 [Patiriisocius sp.]
MQLESADGESAAGAAGVRVRIDFCGRAFRCGVSCAVVGMIILIHINASLMFHRSNRTIHAVNRLRQDQVKNALRKTLFDCARITETEQTTVRPK